MGSHFGGIGLPWWLRGIIEHRALWCTDVAYLNDPSEIKYGVSIAADGIVRLTSNEQK
jgi:hypothetical protein